MVKLSVEQALAKAKAQIKKGEVAEAKTLYATILKAFPNNKKAQKGLAALGRDQRSVTEQSPPQLVIDQLMNLYNQGQLEAASQQAQNLTAHYPRAIVLWNILGGSALLTRLSDNYAPYCSKLRYAVSIDYIELTDCWWMPQAMNTLSVRHIH